MQLDLFPSTVAPNPPTEVETIGAINIAAAAVCSIAEPPHASPQNLAELLAHFEDAASDHPRRGQTRSAIRMVGRVLQRPLENLPAEPARLQQLFQAAKPALAGVKPRTWIQYKSTVLGALRNLGVEVRPSRDSTPMSLGWEALHALLPDRKLAIGLSRLLRYFSRMQIAPDAVTEASFSGFQKELIAESVRRDGAGAYRESVRHWNRAARTVPGWPQIVLPERRDERQYTFNWAEFLHSFTADVEAFLNAKAHPDPLWDEDDVDPVRPETTKGRRAALRRIASAAVLNGAIKMKELRSLKDLATEEVALSAVDFLRKRPGRDGKISKGMINDIYLLRTIAIYWVKEEKSPEPQRLKALIKKLSKTVGKRRDGLTDKNRELLRQFDLDENVDALISLPAKTLRLYGDGSKTGSESRIMYALILQVLLFAPLRSGNLTELKFGQNLIDSGRGTKREVRLFLPAAMMKSNRDFRAWLSPQIFPLLDNWITVHRPKTTSVASPYLFPSPSYGRTVRSRQALATRVCEWIRAQTGLQVNLHLFRHIAAMFYLRDNPDGIETVRQFLGHKSISVTIRFYAEWSNDPAFQSLERTMIGAGSASLRKKGARR